jgi:hypothetical protein
MGLAAMSGPVLFAGIVWAGPAQADANSYLTDVRNAGIRDDGGDPALLQTGQRLCLEIGYGASPRQLQTMAAQQSGASQGTRGLTADQADALVDYAIVDLCPNY